MIEVYNKYDRLEVVFEKTDSYSDALQKCKQLKIKGFKFVVKSLKNLYTYYCSNCKKRSYFEKDPVIACQHCLSENHLFFVGFKQSKELAEEIIYAN